MKRLTIGLLAHVDAGKTTLSEAMLYQAGAVRRLGLPVVKNPCPANGSTKREEMKELLLRLDKTYPQLKKKIFGAIQRYPLYGWSLEEEQR